MQAGQPISITAQDSTDPDLDYLFYRWDWGDGTTLGAYDDNVIITSHTYAAAGTYTIRLTLTDNFGATARKLRAMLRSSSGTHCIVAQRLPDRSPSARVTRIPLLHQPRPRPRLQ